MHSAVSAGDHLRPADRTDVLVSFEGPGTAVGREVSGTVVELGGDGQAQEFHGWLQLLGALESITVCTREPSEQMGRPARPED